MIVMIWAQMQPVGVDVEAINRNISQKVIQRMFHPNEIAWLTKYPKQAIHFWTAKESLAKATGLGGYRSFKRFPIVSHKTDLTSKSAQAMAPETHYTQQPLDLHHPYIGAT